MKPVLVLVCGSPASPPEVAPGGYADWFDRVMDAPIAAADARLGELPDPSDYSAVVISGSASGVHEELPWMQAAARWVVSHDLPTLGVCFGHQLLAWAHGGVVRPHRPEYGVYEVEVVEEDPLFEGLGSPFAAFLGHFDAVVELPDNARVLARNERAVQALAFGDRVRTVQFHPEFTPAIVDSALTRRGPRLEVLDPGHVQRGRESLRELPGMRRLLDNFLKYYVKV